MLFLLFANLLSLIPVAQAQEPTVLIVDCDKPYFYIKGETMQISAWSNISTEATLTVYWNWRTFTENELVFENTQTLNHTWNLPTVNQKPGFYRIVVSTENHTITMWRTLIHLADWSPKSLPFTHTWQKINYTFEGRILNATYLDDFISITYPTVPFPYSANLFTNNMSFLIRLSGNGWAVDISYFTIHFGIKWILNGTIPNTRSFYFQCSNNPSKIWDETLYEFKSLNTYLTFSWIDLALEQQEFVFNSTTQILNVTIPDSGGFRIDPVLFLDGFETGYTPWDGTTAGPGGGESITINQTVVHHGVNSSKSIISGTANNEYAYCYEDGSIGSQDNLSVRFYFQFDVIPSGDAAILRFKDTGGDIIEVRIIDDGDKKIRVRYSDEWTWTNTDSAAVTLNDDTWHWLEMFVYRADSGIIKIWLDGNLIHDLTPDLDNRYDTLDRIDVGICYTYTQEGLTAFIDCVLAQNEYPIGAEEEGQDLTFLFVANSLGFANMITAFDRLTQDLTFIFAATGNGFASLLKRMEKGFLFSGTSQGFASMVYAPELLALDLSFIFGALSQGWTSLTTSFDLLAQDLTFTFGAVSLGYASMQREIALAFRFSGTSRGFANLMFTPELSILDLSFVFGALSQGTAHLFRTWELSARELNFVFTGSSRGYGSIIYVPGVGYTLDDVAGLAGLAFIFSIFGLAAIGLVLMSRHGE